MGMKMKLNCFGLVCLMLNVLVNNFSVMLGRSHRFLGNGTFTSTFFRCKYVLLKDTIQRPEWGSNPEVKLCLKHCIDRDMNTCF